MGANGHTTVTFGSAPGTGGDAARITITGQAGIVGSSDVEATLRCEASADHSADEHFVENIRVRAGNIVAGTGFDIVPECLLGTAYGVWNVTWVWN